MNPHPRLAGLMAFNYTPPNPDWMRGAIDDLCAVCDDVFLLAEDYESDLLCSIRKSHDNIRTVMFAEHKSKPLWNDFTNHCLLMVEASRFQCEWCLWLDHDERLWPKADRAIIHAVVDDLQRSPAIVTAMLPWLTAWGDEQNVRIDGKYLSKKKYFLQRNPFISPSIMFTSSPAIRLHDWPVQTGIQVFRNDFGVLHYGIMTPEQRQDRITRYRHKDPANPKTYLISRTLEEFDEGTITKPLAEMKLTDYDQYEK